MPRKTTDSQPTPQQLTVLEALLSGSSVTDAAEAGAVDRSTVHRWLRSDYVFRAAYNRGLGDRRDAAQKRLIALADTAMGVVEHALKEGDARTAIAVLRGTGLLSGDLVFIGPGNPDAVAELALIDDALGSM